VRKIKLVWSLPTAQALLAEVLLQLGRHSRPPVRGDVYWVSTYDLLCAGLNTPAEKFTILIYKLVGHSVGPISGELIYLASIFVLWYLVAKRIDSYRFPDARAREGPSISSIVPNVLAFIYGILLLIVISLHNVIFTSPRNVTGGGSNLYGDLVRQSLWFLWSLVLIVIPARTLVAVIAATIAKSKARRDLSSSR
jgi:hypothetical protein